jgi:hypothetical protein
MNSLGVTGASWYAVVIEAETVPDVIGPFRSWDMARSVADKWNATQDSLFQHRHIESTTRAFVVLMVRSRMVV